MNIFSSTSLLGRFLNFIADLVILHFLWVICSLPIITIGASTTALYYSLMIRIRRDEGYIHRNFFKSFKQNFRQSTILWLIIILVSAVLWSDYRIGVYLNTVSNGPMGNIFIVTTVILSIPFILICLYIFAVQAKFENKIFDNIKNALLMSIAHFGYTLLLIFISATFILLTLASTAFIGIEILCGASLYAYLTGNIFIAIFRKHLPDEIEDDKEANGMNNPDSEQGKMSR